MHNIKTSWISMINFVKRVLSKYHTLFMKIALDVATIPLFNLIYLCSLMWKLCWGWM
jgi:hypothetical protein